VKITLSDAATGQVVATVSSGADGKFEVTLKPGRYRIVAGEDKGPGATEPDVVTVSAGKVTKVELTTTLALPSPPPRGR
jgi:hypothetical protein